MDRINQTLKWNDQSPQLDGEQLEKFLNVRKSISDDSLLGLRLMKSTTEKRRLIIEPQTDLQKYNNGGSLFKKKIKKLRLRKQCDYRKNICGYITKKIIRQFLGNTFSQKVNALCLKYGQNFQQCRIFLLQTIQHITGPTHVYNLLSITNHQKEKWKLPFKQFFQWFLRERYLRYLLVDGKMSDKNAYIQYKNQFLLNLIPKNQKLYEENFIDRQNI